MSPTTVPPARRDRRPVPGSSAFDRTNPFVYLGTRAGVRKSRARDGALIAPLDMDPELMQWPVAGLSVLLVADEEHKAMAARVAGVMIRDGATLVSVVADTGPISFHRQLEAA